MTNQTVVVEQVDRDAAAEYYYSAGGSNNTKQDIKTGKRDNWFRVLVFARHRLAERERAASLLKKAIDRWAEITEHDAVQVGGIVITSSEAEVALGACQALLEAIRTGDPT